MPGPLGHNRLNWIGLERRGFSKPIPVLRCSIAIRFFEYRIATSVIYYAMYQYIYQMFYFYQVR